MRKFGVVQKIALGVKLGLLIGFAPAAWADNVAHCEVLLIQNVESDELEGTVQIAAYHPAINFIASVHDDAPEFQTHVEGNPIQALLCRRNDVIPAEADYPMMATGIPFVLSQDFDRQDTDSLSTYWKDGKFQHVYKGFPLSPEAEEILNTRLADFSKRGLNAVAAAKAEEKAETADKMEEFNDEPVDESPKDLVKEVEVEVKTETDLNIQTETETHAETENKAEIETEAEIKTEAEIEAESNIRIETAE